MATSNAPCPFKPGQLVAHKTQPSKPWVVKVTGFEDDSVICARFPDSDSEVIDCPFFPHEIEPYTDAVVDLFERLIVEIDAENGDGSLTDIRNTVISLHRQYMDMIETEEEDDG